MLDLSHLKKQMAGELKTEWKPLLFKPRPFELVPDSAWGQTFRWEGRRYYKAPDGNAYPSVTTFLKTMKDDNDWVEKWRKKVGPEEAARISKRSTVRGEAIHLGLENYLQGLPVDKDSIGEFMFMFEQIRLTLHENLDSWSYIEHALYSPTRKIAGRVDLMGEWKGRRAIIDYKNKNRVARKKTMDSYFLQACTYAILHEEMYGEEIEDLVIIASAENFSKNNPKVKADVHIDPVSKWRDRAIAANREFLKNHQHWYDIPLMLTL